MTPPGSEPPKLRFLRLKSIAVAASGYVLTFEDEDGEAFETTATVDDRHEIRLVRFSPDLTYAWNGTAQSIRRIANIVLLFDEAHVRRPPDE